MITNICMPYWEKKKLLGKRGKKHDYDNEEDEREEAKEGKLEEKKARREWIKNDLEWSHLRWYACMHKINCLILSFIKEMCPHQATFQPMKRWIISLRTNISEMTLNVVSVGFNVVAVFFCIWAAL